MKCKERIYMRNIKIFTDSTSDLNEEFIKQYNISIVPLYVNFEGSSYKDGIDITTKELYAKVESYGKLPLTSAPSPGDFIKAFTPYIDDNMDILYVGLSSELSSTIQNAILASKEFPEGRIEIIDALNVHLGIGILVLKAADLIKEGKSLSEVTPLIRDMVSKVRVSFIIDTLDYLHKGGRCSGVQHFVGGILKIRPIINMENGKILVWSKQRGKHEKSLRALVNKALADKVSIDLERIFVCHSEALEDALHVKKELERELSTNNILIADAGCVISCHCGPKTVGITYLIK